jgi:hypothetical protein
MNDLDDTLSVKKFVEDYLTRFYGEKPLLIDWVKAVKVLNTWNLSIRVRFKDREYGLGIYVDALRKICIGHAITGIAVR